MFSESMTIEWVCIFIIMISSGNVQAEFELNPDLHCIMMPSAVVELSSSVSGQIETILVERGDSVRAGQTVAKLESVIEESDFVSAQIRADLDTELQLRKSRLAYEMRKLERSNALLQDTVFSEQELDKVQTDEVLARWQLRQAVDDRYLARIEMDRAKRLLEKRSLYSPINGVVVERYKWPGEFVNEDPIVRIATLDPLWIEVVVPVSMYDAISEGMVARVTSEMDSETKHSARVTVIDPMGDAASGTFRVRLTLPNPDRSLLAGTKCTATFPHDDQHAAPVLGAASNMLARDAEIQEKSPADDDSPLE